MVEPQGYGEWQGIPNIVGKHCLGAGTLGLRGLPGLLGWGASAL